MAQLFHHSANSLARVSLLAGVFVALTVGGVLAELQRSTYVTRQHEARVQNPPFSHQHHVGGMGLDCRYCHSTVEDSSFAGIPPTKTCMNCHSQIWTNAPMLEPVRESFRSGKSLQWVRVHDLPDFVYFDHSIHLSKGVGCKSCHGPVDNMPLMYMENSLQMEWCIGCHRQREMNLRPKSVQMNAVLDKDDKVIDPGIERTDNLFSMSYEPPSAQNPVTIKMPDGAYRVFRDQRSMGEILERQYHLRSTTEITSCSTCHR
jgi:hypothetical protein